MYSIRLLAARAHILLSVSVHTRTLVLASQNYPLQSIAVLGAPPHTRSHRNSNVRHDITHNQFQNAYARTSPRRGAPN